MKPIIRFRQYNKEWRPFKLNTILVPSNEKNTKGLYSKNDVLSVSGEAGIVNQIAFQGRSFAGASVLNYGVVNTNDIVYTKSPLRNNPYGIIKTNNGPSGIVSTLYAIYNCCEESCPQFVDTYFTSSSRTNNYLRPLVRKGAKNDMKVSSEGALQGNVIFPYKDEQIEIASYFRILDAKLQASAKKVDSLKKLKSASLVAMFPQNGESTPKVRFKGFEGEWKETTLSECLDISYLQNSENKYDKNDVLSVSDDFGVMNQIELLGRSYAGKDVSSYSILQKGEIVYTKSPLKDKPFGIIKKNSYQTGIVSILYAVYHSKDNISADYIHYYFDPAWRLNAYMRPLVNKGAKNTMNISDEMALMGSLIIPPSLAEQQAIAAYFRSLDRKIALETARLEKLKQIKLACLDKMFV